VDLVRELSETSSWVHLGLYLGLPKYKLNEIYTDYGTQGLARCKLEMLSCILDWRGDTLSWATVVEAVSKTGNNRIAKTIAGKHGTLYYHSSLAHIYNRMEANLHTIQCLCSIVQLSLLDS